MSAFAAGRQPSASADEIEIAEDNFDSSPTPAILHGAVSTSTVDIDGVDWHLTTLLITIDALLLELYRTGDTKWSTFLTWFWEVDCDSGWACQLAETMFLIFVAVINVFIVVPIVNINIRTPSRQSWRFWLLASWASLFLLDIITIIQLTDSISKAANDEGVDYSISHFWLVCTASILTIALNVRFLLLYGPFVFLTCNEEVTLKSYSGLRGIIGLPPAKITVAYLQEILRIRGFMSRSMYAQSRPDWKLDKLATFKLAEEAKNRINRFLNRRRLAKNRDTLKERELEGSIQHMATEDVDQYLAIVDSESKFMFKLGVVWQKIMTWFDMIAEEPGTFEYTSWMKAAIAFCVLMLIYNCIKAIEMIFALDSAWDLEHNVAVQLHDGLESIHQTATDFDAEVQTSADALQQQIASIQSAIDQFLPQNATDSGSYRDAASLMHLMLMSSSKLAKQSDFSHAKVIAAFFYVDSLLKWLKYACLVGYPIGTFIGFYSIFQVMSQHKRMAMSLEYEAEVRCSFVMRNKGDEKIEIKDTLMGLEEKYPIGGAVYFFGVLMSTAVIQQHVFGAMITLFLSVFLNIKQVDVLLDIGGSVIVIYIVIITTNLFCSHVIGDRILTQDGYKIKHPWLFFLFLFAFTIVHAVLGFLYALWRALLLLITTIWVLNRLDISLFTTGKRLDNGHYSFMSMLLLSQVIHLEKKSRKSDEEQAVVSPLLERRMTMNNGLE